MATFATILRLRSVLTPNSIQGYRQHSGLSQILRRKDNFTQTHIRPATGYRHLFAATNMGIDGYIQNREKAALQFQNIRDKFRQRMIEAVESDDNNMIFTDDLKNAVHLAEPTEDDISLVIGMAKKFNKQNSGLRFGAYVFGPVIMRMLHHLNQPDTVLQVLRMEELEGFFNQLISYQLALDLLYDQQRYQDVLEVFKDLQEKRINGIKYPKSCMTIAFAACYKLNTQESYETTVKIMEGAHKYGSFLNFRSIMFASALAYNQSFPHVCLEIMSQAKNVTHIGIRNLKAVSFVEVGRVEDALPILRAVLQLDLPYTPQHGVRYFFRDTIVKVEHAVKETGSKELIAEFQHISNNLEANGFITENSLDELVTEPMKPFQQNSNANQDRAMLAASFHRTSRNTRHKNNYRQRPGLTEME